MYVHRNENELGQKEAMQQTNTSPGKQEVLAQLSNIATIAALIGKKISQILVRYNFQDTCTFVSVKLYLWSSCFLFLCSDVLFCSLLFALVCSCSLLFSLGLSCSLVFPFLLGGFALSTLTSGDNILTTNETVPTIAMLLFYLSVHACTCSAVACFWIYRKVAAMNDGQAMLWASKRKKTLAAPAAAFAIGALGYIVGVIFFTLDAVSDSTLKLTAVYVISAMCGSFLMTLGYTIM